MIRARNVRRTSPPNNPRGLWYMSMCIFGEEAMVRGSFMRLVGSAAFFGAMTSAAAGPAASASADEMQIRTFMAEVYGPYLSQRPEDRTWKGWTDRDLYSNQVSQLIQKWRVVHEEADYINDQDGLCDCQALNGRYAFDIQSLSLASPDRATVRIETRNGTVGPAHLTFSLVRENGKWRIDDIYWASRKLWMRDALHRIIAAESAR